MRLPKNDNIIVYPAVTLIAGGIFYLSYLLMRWTESNLEFWLSRFSGHPVDVPFWMAALLTAVLDGLALAADLLSEIIRLAL